MLCLTLAPGPDLRFGSSSAVNPKEVFPLDWTEDGSYDEPLIFLNYPESLYAGILALEGPIRFCILGAWSFTY